MGKKPTVKLDLKKKVTKDSTTSVSTPSAQSPTLCGAQLAARYDQIITERITKARILYGLSISFIVDLLLTSGCRVSEALALCKSQQITNQSFMIRGLKGSKDRIVYTTYCYSDVVFCGLGDGPLSQVFSRFSIYRVCKRLGIVWNDGNNQHNAVTHAGRHFVAELLLKEGFSVADVQNFLGHRRISSTEFYAKE